VIGGSDDDVEPAMVVAEHQPVVHKDRTNQPTTLRDTIHFPLAVFVDTLCIRLHENTTGFLE
jgi:hypothetical protein